MMKHCIERSMFPYPRYHAQKKRADERGNEIRALAGALARCLEEENVQAEWRGSQQRSFQRFQGTRQWRPYFYGYQTG